MFIYSPEQRSFSMVGALKVVAAVVVVAMCVGLLTEAKTSGSGSSGRDRRKSSRSEKNQTQNTFLKNIKYQNNKLLRFFRDNHIEISEKDLKNYPLVQKCGMLFGTNFTYRPKNREKEETDLIRRMLSLHDLLYAANKRIHRDRTLKKETRKVINAIRYYRQNITVTCPEENKWLECVTADKTENRKPLCLVDCLMNKTEKLRRHFKRKYACVPKHFSQANDDAKRRTVLIVSQKLEAFLRQSVPAQSGVSDAGRSKKERRKNKGSGKRSKKRRQKGKGRKGKKKARKKRKRRRNKRQDEEN